MRNDMFFLYKIDDFVGASVLNHSRSFFMASDMNLCIRSVEIEDSSELDNLKSKKGHYKYFSSHFLLGCLSLTG